MLRLAIALGLVFGVGACVGQQHGETKVEFIEVPHTKIVTETGPTVTVEVMPESCLNALAYAFEIGTYAEKNYAFSDQQLQIISDVRLAIAENSDTSDEEVAQRQLQGRMVGNLADMEKAFSRYVTANDECNKETK